MPKEYKKFLSIIIPHYNTADLLQKLIDSIPHVREIQIIVVDDNSNTQLDKLSQLQLIYNNQVEFYTNNTFTKGAGVCRNIGLQHALGKWILFADADDFFTENFYETVQRYFNSDYDEVFFIPTSIYLDTGKTARRHTAYASLIQEYLSNPTHNNLLKLKFSTASPWSKLIRHSLIYDNDIKFSEILYSNDIMFSVKCSHYSKKITASKDIIYCITQNKGSLTTHKAWDVYEIRLMEYINVCNFLMQYYSTKDVKLMHYTCLSMLYAAFKQHYGIRKYIFILKLFYKQQLPLFTWEQLHTDSLKQIFNDILFKRKDSKYYIKKNTS